MLVDDAGRWVFVHIPKTAGQAVSAALGHRHESHHHRLDGIDDYKDYFRFCFVRHPAERFISAYRYSVHMAKRGVVERHPVRRLILENDLTRSVGGFIDYVMEEEVDFLRSLHFRPQSYWIQRGRPQFVGRYETFDADLRRVGRIIGAEVPDELPRVNSQNIKIDAGLKRRHRIWIREVYEVDFETLGYRHSWAEASTASGSD